MECNPKWQHNFVKPPKETALTRECGARRERTMATWEEAYQAGYEQGWKEAQMEPTVGQIALMAQVPQRQLYRAGYIQRAGLGQYVVDGELTFDEAESIGATPESLRQFHADKGLLPEEIDAIVKRRWPTLTIAVERPEDGPPVFHLPKHED